MRSPNGWKEVHPEEDILPPRKPHSVKTMKEMYWGRRSFLFQTERQMPSDQWGKLRDWMNGFFK